MSAKQATSSVLFVDLIFSQGLTKLPRLFLNSFVAQAVLKINPPASASSNWEYRYICLSWLADISDTLTFAYCLRV